MSLDVTRDRDVLVLTLARPEALNALTTELLTDLYRALAEADEPKIRAVVISGKGRAFCVGQDLDEVIKQPDLGPNERLERYYAPTLLAVRELNKPVVAAINGSAAGAGIGLALACDLRVMAESGSFTPAFSALGLIPDSGTSWFAARILGTGRALEWLAGNRRLRSAELLELGLVTEVCADDQCLQHALVLATNLAAMPGQGVGLTKVLVNRALGQGLSEHLRLEGELQQAASEDPAYLKQIEAFLAKRSARA